MISLEACAWRLGEGGLHIYVRKLDELGTTVTIGAHTAALSFSFASVPWLREQQTILVVTPVLVRDLKG